MKNENEILYSNPYGTIRVSASRITLFLSSNKPADLIALYIFYVSVSNSQYSQWVTAPTEFVASKLRWSINKTRKTKKELIRLGLIKDVTTKDINNRIVRHYINIL